MSMEVKDTLQLVHLGTRYELVGAKTGKSLYKSWVNKNLDKYIDLEVASTPLDVSLCAINNTYVKKTECVYPVLHIWVSGK